MNKIVVKFAFALSGLLIMLFCTVMFSFLLISAYLFGESTGQYIAGIETNAYGEAGIEFVLGFVVIVLSVYTVWYWLSRIKWKRRQVPIFKVVEVDGK